MAYQRKRKNGACTNCRRAHQKCDYPDEDKVPLECRRCLEKGLKCERNKRKKNKPRAKSTEKVKIKKSTRVSNQAKSVTKMNTRAMDKTQISIKQEAEKELQKKATLNDIQKYSYYLTLFSTKLEERIFQIDREIESHAGNLDEEGKEAIFNRFEFPKQSKELEEQISAFVANQKYKLRLTTLDEPNTTVLIMLQYVQVNLMLNAFYYRHATKKKSEEFKRSFFEPFSTLQLIRRYIEENTKNVVAHLFFFSTVSAYFYYQMEQNNVDTFSLNVAMGEQQKPFTFDTQPQLNKSAIEYADVAANILSAHEFKLSSQMLQQAYSMLITVYDNLNETKKLNEVMRSLQFLCQNNAEMKLIASLDARVQYAEEPMGASFASGEEHMDSSFTNMLD